MDRKQQLSCATTFSIHPTSSCTPPGPDCFFEYRFFGDAFFVRDEAGKIKEIKWKGYGFDFTWVKQ